MYSYPTKKVPQPMCAHWEIGLGKIDASKKNSYSEDDKG